MIGNYGADLVFPTSKLRTVLFHFQIMDYGLLGEDGQLVQRRVEEESGHTAGPAATNILPAEGIHALILILKMRRRHVTQNSAVLLRGVLRVRNLS